MMESDTTHANELDVTSQPKECYFINMLPRDVRLKIFRILLRKSVGSMPCSSYSRQAGREQSTPREKSCSLGLSLGWRNFMVSVFTWQRSWDNRNKHREPYDDFEGHIVQPLHGIALLRCCRQLDIEVGEVLYGENTFHCDYVSFHHHSSEIQEAEDRIPETPQSQQNTVQSIQRFFGEEIYEQEFLFRDSLIRFFNQIRIENASRIRRIRLEGQLKTGTRYYNNPFLWRPPGMGLGSILRIITVVLKHACPRLWCLTLITTDGHYMEGSIFRDAWYDDGDRTEPQISDEDKIDDIVAMVAKYLPSLTQLNLYPFERAVGDVTYSAAILKSKKDCIEDETHPFVCGESKRWVKFEERAQIVDDSTVRTILGARNQQSKNEGNVQLPTTWKINRMSPSEEILEGFHGNPKYRIVSYL